MKTYRIRHEKITQAHSTEGRLRYMVKTLIESGDISTKLEEEMHVRELAFFMFLLSMDLNNTRSLRFIENYKANPWRNETGDEFVDFLAKVMKFGPVGVKSIEVVQNENLVRVRFDDGGIARTFRGPKTPYQFSEKIVKWSKNNLTELHSLAISETDHPRMPNPYKTKK